VINASDGDQVLDHGEYVLDHVNWIHHDGTGYIFPEATTVHLTNREERGSWWDITKQWNTSREQVAEQVFKLWIDHGARPQGRRGGLVNEPMIAKDITYQYIVVPSVELEEMKQSPGIEIIANNRWIQGVKHGELDMAQLIFYRAGSVQISEKRTLTIDHPGAILVKMEGERIMDITVADPSRLLDRIHLTVSGQIESRGSEHFHVDYDPVKQVTKLTFELPTGYYRGQSLHVKF
jgi:chondroitin AC lyase